MTFVMQFSIQEEQGPRHTKPINEHHATKGWEIEYKSYLGGVCDMGCQVCGRSHQGSQKNIYIHLLILSARHVYGKIQDPTHVCCPAIYLIHFRQIFCDSF